MIADHCMRNRVIFDLSTARAPEKMPVLPEHDPQQIVGFTAAVRNRGQDRGGGDPGPCSSPPL